MAPNSNCDTCRPTTDDSYLYGSKFRSIPRFKQRFSFIIPPVGHGAELAALDCLKVCDTTVLLVSANVDAAVDPNGSGSGELFDQWGHRVLNMALAQGIPTPIVTLMDLESIAPKKRTQVRANCQKYVARAFPDEKLVCMDTNAEALNQLR